MLSLQECRVITFRKQKTGQMEGQPHKKAKVALEDTGSAKTAFLVRFRTFKAKIWPKLEFWPKNWVLALKNRLLTLTLG